MDWAGVVAAIAAVVGLLLTLFRLMLNGLKSQLDARDAEQEKRLDEGAAKISAVEGKIAETRTELHRDYVHRDTLTEFQRALHDDIAKIFEQINGLSRDLNQLIGRVSLLAERRAKTRDDGHE